MKKIILAAAFALLLAGAARADAPTLSLTVTLSFSGLTSEQVIEKVQRIMALELGGTVNYEIRQQSSATFTITPGSGWGSTLLPNYQYNGPSGTLAPAITFPEK